MKLKRLDENEEDDKKEEKSNTKNYRGRDMEFEDKDYLSESDEDVYPIFLKFKKFLNKEETNFKISEAK